MRNKNIFIGILLAIVVLMATAFAAFSANLNITDTASTSKTWDVKITSITPDAEYSSSTPLVPGSTSATVASGGLSASFTANLISPGDSVTYTVRVTNSGTLAAKVSNISFTSGNTTAITNTYAGIAQNNTIAAGAYKDFTVTTTYNSTVTEQPSVLTSSCSITLTFIQNA